MPSDPAALKASLRVRALWDELACLYDGIESELSRAAVDVERLGTRMAAVMNELAPLAGEVAALRAALGDADPSLAGVWNETDAVISALATRQPRLVRAAKAARDAAAARLAHLTVTRSQATRYDSAPADGPRITSRLA